VVIAEAYATTERHTSDLAFEAMALTDQSLQFIAVQDIYIQGGTRPDPTNLGSTLTRSKSRRKADVPHQYEHMSHPAITIANDFSALKVHRFTGRFGCART
jgi:CO dehydrogenase/acetyl-CoA synthase gamma subunit (corrinoid Fe-S protein)